MDGFIKKKFNIMEDYKNSLLMAQNVATAPESLQDVQFSTPNPAEALSELQDIAQGDPAEAPARLVNFIRSTFNIATDTSDADLLSFDFNTLNFQALFNVSIEKLDVDGFIDVIQDFVKDNQENEFIQQFFPSQPISISVTSLQDGISEDPTPVSYTVDDNDGNTSNEATITIDYGTKELVGVVSDYKITVFSEDAQGDFASGDFGIKIYNDSDSSGEKDYLFDTLEDGRIDSLLLLGADGISGTADDLKISLPTADDLKIFGTNEYNLRLDDVGKALKLFADEVFGLEGIEDAEPNFQEQRLVEFDTKTQYESIIVGDVTTYAGEDRGFLGVNSSQVVADQVVGNYVELGFGKVLFEDNASISSYRFYDRELDHGLLLDEGLDRLLYGNIAGNRYFGKPIFVEGEGIFTGEGWYSLYESDAVLKPDSVAYQKLFVDNNVFIPIETIVTEAG